MLNAPISNCKIGPLKAQEAEGKWTPEPHEQKYDVDLWARIYSGLSQSKERLSKELDPRFAKDARPMFSRHKIRGP